jgi:hypothetical protein
MYGQSSSKIPLKCHSSGSIQEYTGSIVNFSALKHPPDVMYAIGIWEIKKSWFYLPAQASLTAIIISTGMK